MPKNFLFVDAITTLNPGKQTVGLKYVTPHDIYLAENLALFPCVVGEALGQLCSWNVLQTTDFQFRPVGGLIQEIHMCADAQIGDTILLESEIGTLDADARMVSFSGRASVAGKTLLTISHSVAPLLPLAEFNDERKVRADFVALSKPYSLSLQADTEHHLPAKAYPIAYDTIIAKDVGTEIIAQKYITPEAPYFADHFPKKPVLPLSLLMEYNLQLGFHFFCSQKNTWRPIKLSKVKIGNFILPRDTLVTRATLKESNAESMVVAFHNAVGDKRVCVAEVLFGSGDC